jgi:predicted HicB family RNase H-like nuclease
MPAPKPKKAGRPALPKGNAKAVMLRVRITPKELKAFEAAAKANNQSVSEWIREKLGATIGE